MPRQEAPPFLRGETLGVSGTDGSEWLGREYEFEDLDYDNPPKRRSEFLVTCRVVRNSFGAAVEAKRLVTFKAGTNRSEVDGYADATGEVSVPTDEWLTNNVSDADVFYVVVHGPAVILTDLAGGSNNNISEDDVLVALTAATSQATTAGRVKPQITSAASTADHSTLITELNGGFGRALSAKTTGQTNEDILVHLGTRWD